MKVKRAKPVHHNNAVCNGSQMGRNLRLCNECRGKMMYGEDDYCHDCNDPGHPVQDLRAQQRLIRKLEVKDEIYGTL